MRCPLRGGRSPTSGSRGCDVQVVGQSATRQLGVARFLEEAVASEAEGVIDGDPLGAEHGEGIAEAGRVST